ncbi:MAG: FlgD immunoglobulin-like domain containing protein, partial [Candidatus Latescibacteria bacterium]|nr:FlgD immunoglobulin-like domain containing protein [Candidatus Latescibacterota bacterium]
YELFGLPERVPVDLAIYGLDGRKIATVPQGLQTAGPQTARWDGRDQSGATLPPGIYLIAITVQSERSGDDALRPLGLAY